MLGEKLGILLNRNKAKNKEVSIIFNKNKTKNENDNDILKGNKVENEKDNNIYKLLHASHLTNKEKFNNILNFAKEIFDDKHALIAKNILFLI